MMSRVGQGCREVGRLVSVDAGRSEVLIKDIY